MAYDYRNRPRPRFSDWRNNPDYRDERREVRGEDIGGENNYGIDNDRDYRFREQQWRADAHPHYPTEPHPVNAAFGTRMGNFGQIVYDPSYGIDTFGYHNEAPAHRWHIVGMPENSQNRPGSHRGKGPKNYLRSDERISEDINDRLQDDPYVDASDIEVRIDKCEVILSGTVDDLRAKRRAADIAEDVRGVRHVENHIRVRNENDDQYKFPTATTTGGAVNLDSKAERDKNKR
ncbi:MAG: hypothetical protein K0R82_1832 [Flavipsychrobacter sp.]|nr:hypothetical protein [Flavipsychrobacter sp.]